MSVAGNSGGATNATVRQFLAIIKQVPLMSDADLAEVMTRWPESRHGEDAGALAKELVQLNKLTRFQAAAAYQCKPRGLVIGQYIILDRLGAGGMGTVFKGQHREQGTIVAIKVLASSAVRSADSVERFHREAQTAARLNHPGIVRALEIGQGDGQHYYVMEYVEGTDLSAYIKKQGPLPLDQAVQVVAQAARALAHAHEHGVIHRDIKPGNLIYTKDGQIKILDMGLARLNDPASLATAQAAEGLTQTGQVMGTVDYMAPEQAVNTRLADARADVYSLGCTFYRLVTGKIPFDGESMVEKILAHREQPIPSLGSPTTPVPPAVDHVLRKMLAKKPADRYQTMTELANDLDQCLSGELASGPIVARPLTLAPIEDDSSSSVTFNLGGTPVSGSITQRPRRRSGLLVAAAAAVIVILGGAGAYYFTQMNQPEATVAENSTETTATDSSPTEPATKGVDPRALVELVGQTSPAMKESAGKIGTTPPNDTPQTGNPTETSNATGTTTPAVTPAATNTPPATPMPVYVSPIPLPVNNRNSTTPTPTPLTPNTTPSNTPGTPSTMTPGTSPSTTSTTTTPPATSTTAPTTPATITPATPTPPVSAPVEAMIPTEVVDTRVAMPDQIAVDAALKLIRNDIFKDDYTKAKKPDERVALARKLYEQATKTKSADAEQFAMLCEARDLASDGGDFGVLQSVTALAAANFKLESLAWLVTGIETAQKKALTLPVNKLLAANLLPKVDEAVREGQFATADRLMKATLASVRKASDPPALKMAVERSKELEEEKKTWEIVEKARKVLADNADDPAANLALGRYLLFTDNDWEKGPQHLAKGSDDALKELAELTLKAPTTNDAKLALGDAWWAKVEKATGTAKKEFQFGALYWYEKSLAGLDGLNKAKIDKRVAEAKAAVAGMGGGGSVKDKGTYVRVPVSSTTSIVLRLIPAGSFMMGSPESEPNRFLGEVQHRVILTKPFFIGVSELTQAQYQSVMGTASTFRMNDPDLPVSSIERTFIENFLRTINQGPHGKYLRFRFPTEAEWEYAARAGSKTAYHWGDDVSALRDYAGMGSISPVCSKRPNAWGIYDTCGNVEEFVNDFYVDTPFTTATVTDPQGPPTYSGTSSIVRYVCRGGSYSSNPINMRSASRISQSGISPYATLGVRLACDIVGRLPGNMLISDPKPYLRVGADTGLATVATTTPKTPTKTVPGKTGANGAALAVPSPETYQQLCEWVWQRRGTIRLRYSNGNSTSTRYVMRATDLPQVPYEITGVNLNNSDSASEQDLRFLSQFTWLTQISIYNNFDLTDQSIRAITSMPNLQDLSVVDGRQLSEAAFAPLANNRQLTRLYLYGTPNVKQLIRHLTSCPLSYLSIEGTQVGDAECADIAKLVQLNSLNLSGTQVTDRGLSSFRAMSRLSSLYLNRTQVTDAGMVHLQGLSDLDYLYLDDTAISNAGVALLRSCRDLNGLHLARCRITDAVADTLVQFPLTSLYVTDTGLTDAAVIKLASIQSLNVLNIIGCNVSDACAPALSRLPRLSSLYVGRTRITSTAIANIKMARPNIFIGSN
ncbi:MAG: protein kinase [Planctomycetaceae bacterium]|nr:protein kinase [Planctomycetaceae bacterium]